MPSTLFHIHPKTGRVLREVRVISRKGGRAEVEGLHGPLRGHRYEVSVADLTANPEGDPSRRKPRKSPTRKSKAQPPAARDVVGMAERFRADLARRDEATLARLARSYATVEKVAAAEIDRLTVQIERAMRERDGGRVPVSWLLERERLAKVVGQIRAEVRRFADKARPVVEAAKGAELEAGIEQAKRLAVESMIGTARLNVPRVVQITAQLAPGAPLADLFAELGPLAAERLEQVLVSGVATGRGPKLIARDAKAAVSGLPRARALTIARTETLRAYREASRATWQANAAIVEGWTWLSSMDRTSCAACIAMHGTFHALEEPMDAHPSCRCTMVPEARGVPRNGIPPGAEVFDTLPSADQLAIVGPGKLEALNAGRIALPDLVRVTKSERWGSTRSEAGLGLALAKARSRRRAA